MADINNNETSVNTQQSYASRANRTGRSEDASTARSATYRRSANDATDTDRVTGKTDVSAKRTAVQTGDDTPIVIRNARIVRPEKGLNKSVIIGVIIAVVVIVVVAISFFMAGGSNLFDPSAQQGQAPYKSQEEIQAELDRKVEEGMFNISIASTIEFEDGTSEGTAFIENIPGNPYDMQVTITEDDTGDVLYESKLLKPNSFIENIQLTKDLDAGTYPATATFKAFDTNTHQSVGQAAAKVTISVLE